MNTKNLLTTPHNLPPALSTPSIVKNLEFMEREVQRSVAASACHWRVTFIVLRAEQWSGGYLDGVVVGHVPRERFLISVNANLVKNRACS